MSYHRLSTEGDADVSENQGASNAPAADSTTDPLFSSTNSSVPGAVAIDIENGFDSDYTFQSQRKKGLYTQLETDDSVYTTDTAAALAAKQSTLFTDANLEEEHKSQGAITPSDPDDPTRSAPSPLLSSSSSSSGLDTDDATGLDLIICRVGHANHNVSANSDWTIKQLKTAAFPEESAANKNIRFIFQGKLLADDKPLHFYNIQSQSFIHCAITDPRPVEAEPSPSPEDQAANEEDYRVPTWILAQHQMAVQTREGGSPDFILGFVMGFVLGVLALLWMWQRVPRKQKLGITCGLVCNLFFSFVRFNVNSDSANDSSGSAARGDGGTGTGSG